MQVKLILLRKDHKISQCKLAELLNISQKQYSRKELGKAKFNGDEMFKIAYFFKKKVDEIFLPTTHHLGE